MASKIIKIKVSNASNLQIKTLLLEIGLIIKQWFRKVKVKIEVIKQYGLKNANNNGFKCHYLFCYYMARFNVVIDLTLFSFYDVIIIERINNYANNTSYIFLGNHYNVNDCYIFIKKYMETGK